MTGDDLHHLTGAYALDALPREEREAFERHLAGCEACRRETAELRATVARLGLAASVTPRPGMRGEVLRRIAAVRQESPGGARPRRSLPRVRLLSWWVLAACFTAAALFGGTTVWQHRRAQDALSRVQRVEQGSAQVAAVLAAPDARSHAARLRGGANGAVVVSRNLDRAVFVVSGMAYPPAGKVYQLWFDDDGGAMRSAGLMDPRRSDQAVLLHGGVDRASRMGMTLEPAGGSPRPTSAPLALTGLPA